MHSIMIPVQRRTRISALAAAAAAALVLEACGTTDAPGPATAPVTAVVVSPVTTTLLVGDSQQLTAQPHDARGRRLAGRDVAWMSRQPEVASVSSGGLVTARTPGTTQIVAIHEGHAGTATVTVWAIQRRATECDQAKPGWIWCDDFETDRLASYFEYNSSDGAFARVPGVGYGGSVGMRARFTRQGQVQAGFLHLAFGKTPGPYFRPVDEGTEIHREIYWRHLVKFAPGWTGGGGNKLSRAQSLVTRSWAQGMMAHVWSGSEPGDRELQLGLAPATGIDARGRVRTTSYNDFPNVRWIGTVWSRTPIFDPVYVGRWHCVEARARLDDPGRANGVFELWINGTLEGRMTDLQWHGSYSEYGINTVFLENYWNDGAPQPQERYFDHFVVSTQRIGC